MRNLSILLLILSCHAALATGECKSFNSQLKHKLAFEIGALDASLSSAKNETAQLRQDKADIDVKLQNMENWGNEQEKQKNAYYAQLVVKTNDVAKAQAKVDLEKENSKSTLVRYHRVKSLLGYIVGLVFTFLYLHFGANTIATILTVVAGPWAFMLRFVGPVAAFGVGYMGVNLFF